MGDVTDADWYATTGAENARKASERVKARDAKLKANEDPGFPDAFAKAVAEAEARYRVELDDPEPLLPYVDLPPWPTHVLPDWVEEHALATAERLQVPPDLTAQLGVGVLASACMGNVNVHIGDWEEPTNLYMFVAMHSGAGKGPAG